MTTPHQLPKAAKIVSLAETIYSRRLPPNHKYVLLALGILGFNPVGGAPVFVTDVSVARLSRLLGLHRVTVQKIISDLKARGILKRLDKGSVFQIVAEGLQQLPPLDKNDLLWFLDRRGALEGLVNMEIIARFGPK